MTVGFLLGLIGLGALAGLVGGVGAGNSFGLAGFIPGLTTAAKASLRIAIAKSSSTFPAALAAFLPLALLAAATASMVRILMASASLLKLAAISLRA